MTFLREKGIVVRDCSLFRGEGDSLVGVSVCAAEQNERVVGMFSEFLEGRLPSIT